MGFMIFGLEALSLNAFNLLLTKLNFFSFKSSFLFFLENSSFETVALIVVALVLTKQLIIVINCYTIGLLKNRLEQKYRDQIITSCERTNEEHANELLTAYTYHSEKSSDNVVFFALTLSSLMQLLGYIFYALYLSPKDFILIAVLSLMLVLPIIYIDRKMKSINFAVFNLKDKLNYFYAKIKAKDSQINFQQFHKCSDEYSNKRISFDIYNGIKMGYPEIIGVIAVLIILISNKGNFSEELKSSYIAFFYSLLKIAQVLSRFNFHYSFVKLNNEAYVKIQKIFNKNEQV